MLAKKHLLKIFAMMLIIWSQQQLEKKVKKQSIEKEV